ncbi:hypothetical protein I5677_09070 [Mobilitalea sibirica]|uniref:Uncharacterized protein n=1 Tax=Mobilitalea sibirica TaxID=1462919 RepID=A0A8J7H7A1_9FIRM|nr:hypothetical protein [Mobilitalea sibirica]MBH1941041.1 hypothetical protein [Mobilitalea sibirica]
MHKHSKTEDENITIIKRYYYTIIVLIYIIIIKFCDVPAWCSTGMFGITGEVWSYIILMIVTLLLAVILDSFIISGYVFKEFGFFGARFIRDVTQKTVELQKKYVLSLEGSLKTVYAIPKNIHDYFSDPDIRKKVLKGSFDFPKEFKKILKCYYGMKNIDADVDVFFYNISNEEIDKIVEDCTGVYSLKWSERKILKERLHNTNGIRWYIDKKDYSVYLITIKYGPAPEVMLMISIKSFNEANLLDSYPIYHFVYLIQMEINNIISAEKQSYK